MVQLCIRRAENGALTLYEKEIPLPPDPDASPAESSPPGREIDPTAPSYILLLPDELLEECFRPLVEADLDIPVLADWRFRDTSCRTCRRHRTARRLHRVCRRFARVVRPLLYSNIELFADVGSDRRRTEDKCDHARLFLRTVAQQPAVARCIRRLDTNVDFFTQLIESHPEVVAHLGTTLTDLELCGWQETHMAEQWAQFVEVLRSLRGLTALDLSGMEGEYRGFSAIAPLLKQLPGLSRLTLWAIECPQPPRYELSNWPMLDHAATLQRRLNDETGTLPPQGDAGTSRLEELHLVSCSMMSPTALRNFLLWPRGLEVFTLTMMGIGGYRLQDLIDMGMLSYPWTWHLLRAALQPHTATLRELRVEQMATQEGLDTFSLHDFPALQTFETAFCGLPVTGEAAAALWLTPALKTVVLDCASHDSQCGKIYNFDKRTQDWLVAFAACAAGKPCGLQRIEILLELDQSEWSSPEYDGKMLKYLLETKGLVEKDGIRFVLPEFSEVVVARYNLPRTQ